MGSSGRLRLASGAAAAACIFVIDTFTSLQSAVAVLYVLVLVVIDDGRRRSTVVATGITCGLLACISFVITHGVVPQTEPMLRLGISLAAIAIIAALILRKQRVEATARASDLRYRTIFDTLAVAIWEHDFRDVKRELDALRAEGVTDLRAYLTDHPEFVIRMRRAVRITDANETALRLLQVPTKEHFFSHLSDFLPEHDDSFFECLMAIDEGRRLFETETQVRTTAGDYVDVIVVLSFPPAGEGLDRICGSILDVTERKRVQIALDSTRAELNQAIRAATVGEFSASIAHEVSQPLSAVRSFTDAARRWLQKSPPNTPEALSAMQEAAQAAVHAGEVVDRVRRLISKSEPERVIVDMDEAVRTAIGLSQGQLAGVSVDLVPSSEGVTVVGDRILLQQLLVNLFNNAAQAMSHADMEGRQLRVVIGTEGSDALVSVCDNGPGFTAEAAKRAFDPFFTTRSDGVGLGLGMCRSIVDAHGGTMSIGLSHVLTGACVEIRLPMA